MTVTVSIKAAKPIAPGLWQAVLDPAHVRMLGSGAPCIGNVSILLLLSEPAYDGRSRSLSFGPNTVRVLNVGLTENAIVVLGESGGVVREDEPIAGSPAHFAQSGDAAFIARLTPALRDIGISLLQSVRRHFPGTLVFHPRSEKFVESPDNFWTVRIQPRDRSLRVTVRGKPESFSPTATIALKPDMGSYSNFKVSGVTQIPEAVQVIREAASR